MPTAESHFTIFPLRDGLDLTDSITLYYAYAASLVFDLAFQNFEAEMAGMPGKYFPPHGELLLARSDGVVSIGCVGLRPLPSVDASTKICEMKRPYVTPAARGTGAGLFAVNPDQHAKEMNDLEEVRLDYMDSRQIWYLF